ncbi:hypothetical protein SBV1_200014 [Verrucomicrobia bacterium]|nr:hypothetical protein SBV1_200014 [Verrucomicrobiota bacterium]
MGTNDIVEILIALILRMSERAVRAAEHRAIRKLQKRP